MSVNPALAQFQPAQTESYAQRLSTQTTTSALDSSLAVAQFQPASDGPDSGSPPPLPVSPQALPLQTTEQQLIAQFTQPLELPIGVADTETAGAEGIEAEFTVAQFTEIQSEAASADLEANLSHPSGTTAWTTAQLFNSALDQLPATDRAALRNGDVLVTQSNGQFVGRVLINAATTDVWQILTDYNNLARVFPNIESSKLLRSNNNTHVFEQINVVRFFPVTRRIRVVVAATESYLQQINFSLVEGDVDALQGTWRLDAIAPYRGAAPNQVLVTHQVAITPGGSTPRSLFQSIYADALEDTLAAIKQAAE